MAKTKMVRANTVAEIAKALGLTPAEGAEIAFRTNLNSQIIKIVKKKKITHAQLAKLAGSSRTRMTALLKPKYFRCFYRFNVKGLVSSWL